MRGNHSSYLVRDVCSMAVSRSALNPIARMWESLFDLELRKDTQLALPGRKKESNFEEQGTVLTFQYRYLSPI